MSVARRTRRRWGHIVDECGTTDPSSSCSQWHDGGPAGRSTGHDPLMCSPPSYDVYRFFFQPSQSCKETNVSCNCMLLIFRIIASRNYGSAPPDLPNPRLPSCPHHQVPKPPPSIVSATGSDFERLRNQEHIFRLKNAKCQDELEQRYQKWRSLPQNKKTKWYDPV